MLDTLLLARLSMGDMVALEAKYHAKCLLALYNRARKVKIDAQQGTDRERELSGIVTARHAATSYSTCDGRPGSARPVAGSQK